MITKIGNFEERMSVWGEYNKSNQIIKIAQELPVRQDMVTLLNFVRDNKVIGTQRTGNLPLKIVRDVTAKFVKPPVLDKTIGDKIFRLRSEKDVWPLYLLHILAEVGELLITEPGKRWQLTEGGKRYLEIDPLFQISFLLAVWWFEVNWIVAFPFAGMGEELPYLFNYRILEELLSFPQNADIKKDVFASAIIEKTRLVWGGSDSEFSDRILHSSIERMVISILEKFGVVECEYQYDGVGKGKLAKLQTFNVVPFGRVILETLAIMS